METFLFSMLAPDIEDMIARNVYLRRMESVFKDINLLGDGLRDVVDPKNRR